MKKSDKLQRAISLVQEKLDERRNHDLAMLESAVKVQPGVFSVAQLIGDVTNFNQIMETTYSVRKDLIVADYSPRGRVVRQELAKFLGEKGYNISGINAQKFLEANKKKVDVLSENVGIVALMENDLARAELVIAAQGITDKMQNMAEDLAKMQVETLMPLVDSLKEIFGVQSAEDFNNIASSGIDQALETLKSSKDNITNSIIKLEKGISDESSVEGPSDMETDDIDGDDLGDEGGDDLGDDDLGDEGGDDLGDDDLGDEGGDDLGDDDLGDEGGDDEFGSDEPLGRAEKESYSARGNALLEKAKKKAPKKKGKPDFADIDGDGDRKEPMKKAAADKKKADGKTSSGKPQKGKVPPQFQKKDKK